MTTSLRSYFGAEAGTGAVVFSQNFPKGLTAADVKHPDAK